MPATIDPKKQSIDIGIVVRDGDAALRFYRDTLGLELTASTPMPLGGGGTMHRLQWGTVTVKVVVFDQVPAAANPPGGLTGATGYRYITLWLTNLQEAVDACAAAGYKIATRITEVRPGISIAMVEDPDGNWVELLQAG